MIEVARYIDKFYSENLTVQNLAKGCNLSVYYFIRAFQQVHGCTPHQYLASVRFDSAKHLLLTSNLSVEKIGEIVGFSSGSNFARAFKKEFGYSPTEFRDYTPLQQDKRGSCLSPSDRQRPPASSLNYGLPFGYITTSSALPSLIASNPTPNSSSVSL